VNLTKLLEEIFAQPPVPFDPERQSLKAWVVYCLRDRGLKIVYAQNADFAIEARHGEKTYFKTTDSAENLDNSCGWIVRDPATSQVQIVLPQQ
jgi:hypothetical protein